MATNGDYARVLLSKAAKDEALVAKIGSDTDIADEIIGFHAQQAVEKAIKAVLNRPGILEGQASPHKYSEMLFIE